ncbi:MAG: divalent-cation tolerance protein CutA [Campylobacteraceae bacterium]
MSYIIINTTVLTEDTAQNIINELFRKKLAACVQTDDVASTYRWQGKLQRSVEIKLSIKTKFEKFDDVARVIQDLHPYDVPEIIALPVLKGTNEYLEFIDDALGEENDVY